MALFFDRGWFDQQLARRGMTRADMAISAGVSPDSLDLMFKDQMEVSAIQVSAWALVLGDSEIEVAKRCGVSTPIGAAQTSEQRIASLEARIVQLERQIAILLKQPDALS